MFPAASRPQKAFAKVATGFDRRNERVRGKHGHSSSGFGSHETKRAKRRCGVAGNDDAERFAWRLAAQHGLDRSGHDVVYVLCLVDVEHVERERLPLGRERAAVELARDAREVGGVLAELAGALAHEAVDRVGRGDVREAFAGHARADLVRDGAIVREQDHLFGFHVERARQPESERSLARARDGDDAGAAPGERHMVDDALLLGGEGDLH
ncbi:hypothetical protein T492DRAFT_1132047 [Pavlovales sp. CCMP2436]|nr:hypothetical protein T492DRAFT_1132047 [Pavlovales sp. CCMP2436]